MVLHASLEHVDHTLDTMTWRRVPVLPAEIGTVHAVQWTKGPIGAPVLDADAEALCGRWTRVVLAQRFDADDPDACPACSRQARLPAARPPSAHADPP
jgi:hypothetical protein